MKRERKKNGSIQGKWKSKHGKSREDFHEEFLTKEQNRHKNLLKKKRNS
jgi:hypothetical protein